eukprot:m.270165 g.270165  ORF g.270165 m.270165 type:complete len:332 (-) comp19311_c0_seq9:118-1113(-)
MASAGRGQASAAVEQAKQAISDALGSLADAHGPQAVADVANWLQQTLQDLPQSTPRDDGQSDLAAPFELHEIKLFLRAKLDVTALAPDESMSLPQHGQYRDMDPTTFVHVDEFLFDEDDVDALVDEGKLSRNFCLDCGSHNSAPLNFISHSCSVADLQQLYQTLGDLTGKTVLDIGSRLGPVLYTGYYCSAAARLVGVELNGHMCQLQQQIVDKFAMSKRVQIVEGDVINHADLVQGANVVVLNNVFEFFCDLEAQQRLWAFLRTCVKAGATMATIPSLEVSLAEAQVTDIDLATWVAELECSPLTPQAMADDDDGDEEGIEGFHLYRVLS